MPRACWWFHKPALSFLSGRVAQASFACESESWWRGKRRLSCILFFLQKTQKILQKKRRCQVVAFLSTGNFYLVGLQFHSFCNLFPIRLACNMTCFIRRNDAECMMKSVVLLAFSLCFLFLSICVKEKGKAFSDFPLMQIYTFKKANANPLWITFIQEFIFLLSSFLFWQSLLCGKFAGWISRIAGFKASFNREIPNDKWVISCCMKLLFLLFCSI